MNYAVESLIKEMHSDNVRPANELWNDILEFLPLVPGSGAAHHAWPGGYRDHVQEVMNFAKRMFFTFSPARMLPFKSESAFLVLFLHDCEKPFKYATDEQLENFPWLTWRPTKSDKFFQLLLIEHYGFVLTDEEWNALKYVEGEGDDYVNGERVMNELAAFCHCCDVLSARVWYDFPEKEKRNVQ